MALGTRIWTLWRLRRFSIASVVLALIVAVWSVAQISLLPPRLTPRSHEMATATAHLVVDTPTSSVLDLRQNTYDFEALTQRAILIGNVMANGQVREAIARRANVPVGRVEIAPPFTRKQPRAVGGSASQKHTSDILKSTDQYRISVEANPAVPLLDIYAQAPTAESAEALANGAVDSLQEYLANLAATQQVPNKDQVRLLPLGRAHGTVINGGVDWQVALLAFVLMFSLASACTILLSRVVRGFRVAALADQSASA